MADTKDNVSNGARSNVPVQGEIVGVQIVDFAWHVTVCVKPGTIKWLEVNKDVEIVLKEQEDDHAKK